MGKILKYWPREEIIRVFKLLFKDKKVNSKMISEYHERGLLCHPTVITTKFGFIKNICKITGVKCSALYGDEHIKHMQKLNIKYTKEKVIKILQEGYKKYGKMSPTTFVLKINKDEHRDIRGVIKKFFGNTKSAFKEANIPYTSYHWSKERVITTLTDLYNNQGLRHKCQINKKFALEGKICMAKGIKDRFGSLDDAAELAGFKFTKPVIQGRHTRVGKYEKEILDKIEQEKGIKLIRQFPVAGKFIDGYDPFNNIAYEVDEIGHKYIPFKDNIREQRIVNEIGCVFDRIKIY